MANAAYKFEVEVPGGVKLGVRGEFSDVSGGTLWVRSVGDDAAQAQEQLQAFAAAVTEAAKESVQRD